MAVENSREECCLVWENHAALLIGCKADAGADVLGKKKNMG
jgi:hypothetical protein